MANLAGNFDRHSAALYAKDTAKYAKAGKCSLAKHHLEDAREALEGAGKAPRIRKQVAKAAKLVRSRCGASAQLDGVQNWTDEERKAKSKGPSYGPAAKDVKGYYIRYDTTKVIDKACCGVCADALVRKYSHNTGNKRAYTHRAP